MTIRQYIADKLRAFGQVSEAQLADVQIAGYGKFDLNDDFSIENNDAVSLAMLDFIEEMLFAPKVKGVNEQGFSIQWNLDDLSKYWLYLCRRHGRKPNEEIVAMLDIPTITDRTTIW